MMKYFILFLLFTSQLTWAQLSGQIQVDKREISRNINYTIEGHSEGVMIFDIIVNRQGKVTVCTLNKDLSNVISTPTMIKCKNRIMQELIFIKDYMAPERHLGQVQIRIRLYQKEY